MRRWLLQNNFKLGALPCYIRAPCTSIQVPVMMLTLAHCPCCVSFTENRPNYKIPPKFRLWHHNPAAFQELASDKVVHISDGMQKFEATDTFHIWIYFRFTRRSMPAALILASFLSHNALISNSSSEDVGPHSPPTQYCQRLSTPDSNSRIVPNGSCVATGSS